MAQENVVVKGVAHCSGGGGCHAAGQYRRRGSRQFNLELAAERQGDLFQKLERDGGMVGCKQPVERGRAGLHAARQFRAGDAAALHLAFKLPRDDALERADFALRQQAIVLEEVVEIRTDVLSFHGATLAVAAAFSPVPNLRAEFLDETVRSFLAT